MKWRVAHSFFPFGYVLTDGGGKEGQKAVLYFLELELLMIVNCLSYVVGTKLRFSVCSLNYEQSLFSSISPY